MDICLCMYMLIIVYLKRSDSDFLGYYSVLAGPTRRLIYVLLGFCASLSCWRCWLERMDEDRHTHFQIRYHQAVNASAYVAIRNLVCCVSYLFAFLITLIMVPIDDYIENQFESNPQWYIFGNITSGDATQFGHYYRLAVARLIFISIGWCCMIARYGVAEFSYLGLATEKFQKSQHAFQNNQNNNKSSFSQTNALASFTKTSTTHPAVAVELSSVPALSATTNRSSRLSSSQRFTNNHAYANHNNNANLSTSIRA